MSGSAWAGLPGRSPMAAMAVIPACRCRVASGRESRAGVLPLVVRLPGELTGSGTTCPTTPRTAVAASSAIHPEWWFPGSRAPGGDDETRRDPRANRRSTSTRVWRKVSGLDRTRTNFPLDRRRIYADSMTGRRGSAAPSSGVARALRPPARPGRPGTSSSSISSGGGPSSTVTTQSWHARPRTTQVSQSILVVMPVTQAGTADSPGPVTATPACRLPGVANSPQQAPSRATRAEDQTTRRALTSYVLGQGPVAADDDDDRPRGSAAT